MKRQRIVCWVLLCVFLLALAAPALARVVPDSTVVYVTDTGECYHRKGCSYLKSSNRTTVEEAEARGYRPCSRCDPDELTGTYHSKSSKNSSGSSAERREAPKVSARVSVERERSGGSGIGARIAVIAFAALFFGPMLVGAGTGVVDAFRFRKEKQRYKRFYGGVRAEELVEFPPNVEIGADGRPRSSGAKDWGRFTCYITPHGQSYHSKYGCSGARRKAHVCDVMGTKSPCQRCHPPTKKDLAWWVEYKRIVGIKRKYGIK